MNADVSPAIDIRHCKVDAVYIRNTDSRTQSGNCILHCDVSVRVDIARKAGCCRNTVGNFKIGLRTVNAARRIPAEEVFALCADAACFVFIADFGSAFAVNEAYRAAAEGVKPDGAGKQPGLNLNVCIHAGKVDSAQVRAIQCACLRAVRLVQKIQKPKAFTVAEFNFGDVGAGAGSTQCGYGCAGKVKLTLKIDSIITIPRQNAVFVNALDFETGGPQSIRCGGIGR